MASISEIRSSARAEKAKAPRDHDFSVEPVAPAKAKEWLEKNPKNRNLSKRTVSRYARDMVNGAWKFTAAPLLFNGNGDLIDGQHRLAALIKADKTLDFLIVQGMTLSVQEAIDQGRNRSAADHLSLRDFKQAVRLAASARMLLRIKYNNAEGSGNRITTRPTGMPTNAEVLALVDRHPRLAESVEAIGNTVIGVHPSMMGALHYIGSKLLDDPDTADSFMAVFANGEPAYEGDPAHLWRERLIAQQTKKLKLRIERQVTGTVHAWNLFKRREQLKQFRIPEDAVIEGLDVERI